MDAPIFVEDDALGALATLLASRTFQEVSLRDLLSGKESR